MKAFHILGITAVILACATLNVPAGLFKVKVAGVSYKTDQSGLTLDKQTIANATLIADCTGAAGAQLMAIVDDINDGPKALVVVDPCGSLLCTNIGFTNICSQVAATSNGKDEVVTGVEHFGMGTKDGSITGGGFLSFKATGSPTNDNDVTAFTGKGTATLCDSNNGSVVTITLSISGAFKKASGCP